MSLSTVLLVLHLLSAIVWVGGMFFAYMFLRPVAASQLEPPLRLSLWVGVFSKFFPFVWIAIILLPLTGYIMINDTWNGMANTPVYIHIMNGLGSIMILIFLHVYFAPFKRLKEAVIIQNWQQAGEQLNMIRKLVAMNTMLGIVVIIIAAGGRYL